MPKARRTLYWVNHCLSPSERIEEAGILVEGTQIVGFGGRSGFFDSPDIEVVDLRSMYAMPGFIDTHIHGTAGFDATLSRENLPLFPQMCRTLAAHGVTSFIPTIVSAPAEKMLEAIDTMVPLLNVFSDGAEAVGLHLEGPFIAPTRAGSQNLSDVSPVDLGLMNALIQAGKGRIVTVTFAPELPNAIALIELLRSHNIQPSMGHTDPTEEDVLRAVDAGATRVTHLFNGMPALHQRAVNLAAIALTDDRITVEMILDGTHIHPRMVELACRVKNKSRIVAISDATQGTCMADGEYQLGPAKIKVIGGKSYTEDGMLAGSAQTLETGWARLAEYAKLQNTDACECFTLNPARSLNLNDRGHLLPGKRADIVFYDVQTHEAMLTLIRGKVAFAAPKALPFLPNAETPPGAQLVVSS